MFGRSDYEPLLSDDPDKPSIVTEGRAILTYPVPSSVGLYSDEGLEYTDIMGNTILIPPEKLSDFLRYICLAESPWTQQVFARIFYDTERQPMVGWEQFDLFLHDNPAALVDMRLIMLGARAAQIQIAKVGYDHNALLCDDSKDLISLSLELRDIFQQFYDKAIKLSSSRHRNKDLKTLEKSFQSDWELALQPYIKKYKEDWDTYNLCLNILAIASIVGLIGLICKNISYVYHGKNMSLFQFDAARSKNIEMLDQFKALNLPYPSLEAQNFFSVHREDALQTIQELRQYVERLEHAVKDDQIAGQEEKYRPLQTLHYWLAKSISEFATELEKFRDHKDEVGKREVAEAVFITQWNDAMNMFSIDSQGITYPEKVQTVISDITYLAGQLNNEFQTAPRFALYSSGKK